MPNAQQVQSGAQQKPIWMIRGTCGGCKGFDVQANERELANVKCSKEGSPMRGTKPGILQVNTCNSYEVKTEAPVGFVLI